MQEYDHFSVLMICSPASSGQCPPLPPITGGDQCTCMLGGGGGGGGAWQHGNYCPALGEH